MGSWGMARDDREQNLDKRLMGIEPTWLPWEGSALPLCYSR